MPKNNRRTFLVNATATLFAPLSALAKPNETSDEKSLHAKRPTFTDAELLGVKAPRLVGKNYKVRQETANAFDRMVGAAKKDGFTISVISSYRSFDAQKTIWNRKYRNLIADGVEPEAAIETIVQYSSIPGTSRHHWGTDLDIVEGSGDIPEDPLQSDFFQEGGPYHNLYLWLKENASSYHFYEPYTNDPHRTGFAYEPWHWSFADLSIPFLDRYLKIDLQKKFTSFSIEGKAHFTRTFITRYINQWVKGVNPILLP